MSKLILIWCGLSEFPAMGKMLYYFSLVKKQLKSQNWHFSDGAGLKSKKVENHHLMSSLHREVVSYVSLKLGERWGRVAPLLFLSWYGSGIYAYWQLDTESQMLCLRSDKWYCASPHLESRVMVPEISNMLLI